jgi:hypothetical protein
MFLIQVARGPKAGKLGQGTVYGPYAHAELRARFDDAVAVLLAEGFERSGASLLVQQLSSASAKKRARAAQRLGWMRSEAAVLPLIAAGESAGGDICSILDALGELGDARAVPLLRKHAERKLLSRRRSAVEALRKLNDTEGLAQARQRAFEKLPPAVSAVLTSLGPSGEKDPLNAAALTKAVLSAPAKERGLALDYLYELATPATVAAVIDVLGQVKLGAPGLWRYAKSIFKRAMIRRDHPTFGRLAHAIEVEGSHNKGASAVVKSGLDGVERKTFIFGRRTQRFMRRLAWRHLRKLARWRPEQYPWAAANALIVYNPSDAKTPKGFRGEWAQAYLLMRVLFGESRRFTFDARTLTFKFKSSKHTLPPAGVREEAYPELWDVIPAAYLRVLSAARLPEAQAFAVTAVKRAHPQLLEWATADQLRGMLEAPYEPTVLLALGELSRRFDSSNPDWKLLDWLLSTKVPAARELGLSWLKLTAHLWTRDQNRVVAFLDSSEAEVRAASAELLVMALPGLPELRKFLATWTLERLRAPEAASGDHDRYLRLATEALGDELNEALGFDELLRFVMQGSAAAKSIAGTLLARKPEALQVLGLTRVLALAVHEVAAVRRAALTLAAGALAQLREDPKLVFALVESDWPDTRKGAVELLRQVDVERLGMDGIIGLCDSNHVEIQNLGRELVLKHLSELDPQELLYRLSQHPHPNIRRFALDLVEAHLREGFVALARLEMFFRSALFDPWPDRSIKRRVIDLLGDRGLRDENQAEVAAGILRDFVRTATRTDFERAAAVLVRLKLQYPQLETALSLPEVPT